MKNRIYSSHSFNKTSYYSRHKNLKKETIPNTNTNININTNSNLKEITNKISEIYNYYYSYYFPSILNFSKIYFFEKINKSSNEAISFITQNVLNSSFINNQILSKIKENIESKYNKDYQIISSSYQNYLKNPKKYGYISHFRKHCPNTGLTAMHSCSNRIKGKFILFPGKNSSPSYAICSECKQCYTSDFILMLCIPCNKNYYSTVLSEKEDNNIFPATWEKYHCNTMVNEIMKCIKCHNILYLDLSKKKLICKNKNCGFVSNPDSILWNCSSCKEDFRSTAKVYNPLEFKILRKTINIALLLQKKARPKELPCKCEKDLNRLDFLHKEECKGLLYQGMLLDKEVIVCSKCHSINFEEKFNWICPICKVKFYLHSMVGARPFSKKKYIINRDLNKSESLRRNIRDNMKKNVIYIKNDNYIEKRINNIKTKNFKKEEKENDLSLKDSLSNIKNIDNKNNNGDIKLIYSKDNLNHKIRYHSTLKEILKQRETSQIKIDKDLVNKNYDRYKSQEIKNSSKRIDNLKNNYIYHNNVNTNKTKMHNYINSCFGTGRYSTSSFVNSNNKENNKSPIISDKSPKSIYKCRSQLRVQNESTNISTNKTMNSQNSKDNMVFSSNSSKKNNQNINKDTNQISSFKSWQRKSNPEEVTKNINAFRISYKKKEQINEVQSFQGFFNDFKNSEKVAVNESNPSLKYSLLNRIKNIKNFNININIATSKHENEKRKENNSQNKNLEKNKCFNEKIDEELSNKFEEKPKDQYIRNNLRESLLLKERDNSLQNIIITKEKLENLSRQTRIPLIQETDYTFLNEIGEGTYGEVFLDENNSTSEQYAMKKIICRDYTELIKHKKELELIFSLKHDNILKLLGIQFKYLDETTCLIYVLMELACDDWNNEIKRRTLAKKYYKEKELIDILKQIVKAFLFLQKKNIVHRDIKPQNILLFPNNIYKIADFGEAKNIKNKAEQSTLRGSELFMSPLLYKGYKYNQKKVAHNPYKSDVFSLGYCILYAICLNIKVIESLREVNTIKDVINIINKFNVNVDGKYSEKFMKIIYGMIEPNEEIRFDFEDLFLELNRI